jgi:hypothetical protein
MTRKIGFKILTSFYGAFMKRPRTLTVRPELVEPPTLTVHPPNKLRTNCENPFLFALSLLQWLTTNGLLFIHALKKS